MDLLIANALTVSLLIVAATIALWFLTRLLMLIGNAIGDALLERIKKRNARNQEAERAYYAPVAQHSVHTQHGVYDAATWKKIR